ncbi:unnamed protein product [Clavelina lepadiformis]|uniref:Uncharacterized protein n=1 Tax=Clavelina lepadiformis TaxID=159417 RepID=A0ABP0FX78_CLALP
MIITVSKVIISRYYVTLVTVDQAAYVLFTHEWLKSLTPGIEPGTSSTECSVESHELRINSCKRCDVTNVTNVHSSVQKKNDTTIRLQGDLNPESFAPNPAIPIASYKSSNERP